MTFLSDMSQWCRGRSTLAALVRVPLLGYLAYVGYRQFLEPIDYVSWFGAINLCIHEGGHVLLRGFGDGLIHTAGGTIAQLLAPLFCMGILLSQGDYFGIPVCLGWLSTNLIGVGVYMADARAGDLPLVTAEGSGMSDPFHGHDWANMFTRFGLMDWDTTIGFWTRAAGTSVMILALLIGAGMLILMLWPKSPAAKILW